MSTPACRALFALVFLVTTMLVTVPQPARAQAGLSLAVTQPDGTADKIAAGRDYATETLGDPWDMDNAEDFNLNETLNVSGPTYANGTFSCTAATNDPNLLLLDPGLGGTQRNGRTGRYFPIDTTTYRYFTIRMNVNVASSMQVFWFTGSSFVSSFAASSFVQTTPGWRIYTIDLATTTIVAGDVGSWAGQPATGLRLDHTAASGSTVQIDWVRLTANGDASTTFTTAFVPSDPGSNAVINMYLDGDNDFNNGTIERIATGLREDSATTAPVELSKYAPGNYFVHGRMSRDYATMVFDDQWDMSNAGDVVFTSGMSGATVSGGVFTATSSTSDPFFNLNIPVSTQIDAAVYRSISFQLTLSSASTAQVFWQTADNVVHPSAPFAASAGSNIYSVNLGADPTWAGQIKLFRIDPAQASGISISVDWVSVNTGTTALPGAPTVITTVSGGPLTINTPPICHVLQPDGEGGLDYASFIRNNPWNMAEASDIQLTTGLAGGFPQFLLDSTANGVRGDHLRGQNPNGNADPAVFYLFENTMNPIDANRFRNLSFRMSVTGARDIGLGSVARILWQTTAGGSQVQTSEDIIVNSGWNRYVFDLPAMLKDPGVPANDGIPWGGTMKYFRIDPHEFSTVREFFIDNVKIAADDESNGRFAITWAATDTDDNASIQFFYDTDNVGFNGTAIVSGIEENDPGNVWLWDTRGVPNGTYFVYAVINDGLNTTRRYSTGRLKIDNAGSADVTPPVGALETANTITNASGVTTVTGWALDNVQVASVQLLIDGTPVARPTTGVFRPDVRNLNSSLPDCSEGGFTMSYNPAGLGPGTHSLTVAVFDTSGNRTLLGGAAAGADTVGIFIPASGAYFLRNSNSSGGADLVFTYGPPASTLVPLSGDWDGDGLETIGLYDPTTGAFFLRNSNSPGGADLVFTFGPGGLGWRPVIGDWNADGTDTVGLYAPSSGTFFLKNTNSNGAADLVFGYGPANSTPVVGDWNGDGRDTVGVYIPGTGSWFLRNSNSPGAADIVFNYGPAGAAPITGDWNNDGTDTVGVYTSAGGAWFLRNSNSPGGADLVFTYGPPDVTPIVGDWNGATPKW
ncbi:MAG: hypothetical protein IPF82_14295 [Blastocatellia bacterium]|jgi:hypothetical protein|nr:hypothetical protein [Blastocatellia bacterium]